MSDAALGAILSIVTGLNDNIASLNLSLRSVEERVSRLEAAAFTPPCLSPTSSTTPLINDKAPRSHEAARLPAADPISLDPNLRQGLPSKLVKNKDNGTSQEELSELERQLKPINDGIEALTKHMLRIEIAIAKSETTRLPLAMYSPTSPLSPPPPNLHKPLKRRGSPAKPSQYSGFTYTEPRPIFGKTSTPVTPRRRDLSLNLNGSPYANYTDERSPFAQLVGRKSSNSSALGFKFRFPPPNVQSVSQKSSSSSGTAIPSAPSLRGGN